VGLNPSGGCFYGERRARRIAQKGVTAALLGEANLTEAAMSLTNLTNADQNTISRLYARDFVVRLPR
jgi:hypothetical protein